MIPVEAKSHITEIESKCGAKSSRSLEKIEKALALTAQGLGIAMNASWMENYYQTANRYAHLYFLRTMGVPAWLINVYFTNDKSVEPTTPDEWRKTLERVRERMGLGGKLVPFTSELFLLPMINMPCRTVDMSCAVNKQVLRLELGGESNRGLDKRSSKQEGGAEHRAIVL